MPKRIFIVEDEMVIVRELEVYLKDMGYEVCEFTTTGEGALQQIPACLPDLILMDINLMGEMDGIEVAEKIKQVCDIPLIFVTAFADPELLARAKVTEPYGYVLKPFDPRDLHIAVEIALYKHQAAKDKAALQVRLHQARKMEAVGTMAGGLAHNFNNILWAVMGYTELTLNKFPAGSNERNYLERVLQSCDRAKKIVNQFLTFSRGAEPERQKLQFDVLLKTSLASLQESLPANIAVEMHIAATPGWIAANPVRLQEMLDYLYSNAIQAMQPQGGVLDIRLEDMVLHEEQKNSEQILSPGPYWQLTIRDTGLGMDQATMDRIFEPFFTTKEVGAGMGLGLSVVYGIVRSHDGSIKVSSKPGTGSVFTVLLPKTAIPGNLEAIC